MSDPSPITSSPLAAALAAAQAEVSDPRREKTMAVPGRPSRAYAGLDDLLQAVRPVLARHGLAVTQTVERRGDEWVLVSALLHSGGEVRESCWPLSWQGGPQDQGSRLTYARRYTLEALVGVAATADDDADRAQQSHDKPPKKPTPKAVDTPPPSTSTSKASDGGSSGGGQPAHHPSWPADNRRFMGEVGRLWGDRAPKYNELADWCQHHRDGQRPSQMAPEGRRALLVELTSAELRHQVDEWLARQADAQGAA